MSLIRAGRPEGGTSALWARGDDTTARPWGAAQPPLTPTGKAAVARPAPTHRPGAPRRARAAAVRAPRTARRGQPLPLSSALAYANDDVVHKFLERFDLPWDEACELFAETRRFLWLAAAHRADRSAGRPSPPVLAIDTPLLMLDEMWHTFVLFTREYAAFCRRFLGGYVHHAPTTHAEKERRRQEWQRDPRRALRRERRRLEAQYAYVYERLGEAALRKWYEEFPRRYPPEAIARASRPSPVF